MRLLCAAVLTVSVGLIVATGQDKKESPQGGDRAKRLKELTTSYDRDLAKLIERFQDAKSTPDEKNAIRTEAKELSVVTLERAVKLAEENPKDDTALDAVIFIFQKLGGFVASQPEFSKAIDIVVQHHLGNPKVKDLLLIAGRYGPSGEKLLKAAAEKATDKEVKGVALYVLGTSYAEQIEDADDEKHAAELTAKAIKHFEQAIELAPDAKVGKDTLANLAKSEITAIKSTGIGNPAPDVSGTDLDGKKVKLSSFKGKVVLIDIWATWCPPCRAMIPHERKMVERLKGKPFVLVSISADSEKETLTKFLEKNEMPWVHWWEGEDSPLMKTFRVRAFPTLYLIDHKGIIRKKWVGSPKDEVLDTAVNTLVAAAEKDAK